MINSQKKNDKLMYLTLGGAYTAVRHVEMSDPKMSGCGNAIC